MGTSAWLKPMQPDSVSSAISVSTSPNPFDPHQPTRKQQSPANGAWSRRIKLARPNIRDAKQEPPRGEGVVPLPREAGREGEAASAAQGELTVQDRKSTRLNSSHLVISYAVF